MFSDRRPWCSKTPSDWLICKNCPTAEKAGWWRWARPQASGPRSCLCHYLIAVDNYWWWWTIQDMWQVYIRLWMVPVHHPLQGTAIEGCLEATGRVIVLFFTPTRPALVKVYHAVHHLVFHHWTIVTVQAPGDQSPHQQSSYVQCEAQ